MSAVYFDRLQAGLTAAIEESVDATVVWGPSSIPQGEAGPSLVALRRISGGWIPGGSAYALPSRIVPTEVILTVTGEVTEPRSVSIYATGAFWRVTVPAGTSNADFRDAISESLQELGHSLRATITTTGPASLTIAGTQLGSLVGFSLRGSAGYVATASALVEITTGYESSMVEVQVHSAERYVHGGAHDVLATIVNSLKSRSAIDLLDRYGLSVWDVSPTVDLTKLSGPGWESRASADLHVVQRSFVVHTEKSVEHVVLEADAAHASNE